MSKSLEEIEQDVARLSPEQLAKFRDWFQAFDVVAWDRQIESDINSGKLDQLAEGALSQSRLPFLP